MTTILLYVLGVAEFHAAIFYSIASRERYGAAASGDRA